MNDAAFGELLREYRCAAGLSQEALAERAHLSPGAISTLERSARRAPQHQTLALLAEALRLAQPERARLKAAAATGRRRGARVAAHAAGPAVLNNLPNVLTSFRGRERDLAELDRLITSARRLVTLLGPGGVGKTRLALETARGQVQTASFPAGVWFVDLAPIAVPALVTTAIAQLLGVREQSHEPFLDTLVTAVGAKRLLVLLDGGKNFIAAVAPELVGFSEKAQSPFKLDPVDPAKSYAAPRVNPAAVQKINPGAVQTSDTVQASSLARVALNPQPLPPKGTDPWTQSGNTLFLRGDFGGAATAFARARHERE